MEAANTAALMKSKMSEDDTSCVSHRHRYDDHSDLFDELFGHDEIMQQNSSSEGQIPESGATNEERNVVAICRWQKDHGITHEVLEQLLDKSRDDAAKTLNVSLSTLKRACRDFGITRWPNHKRNMANFSLNQKEDVKKHKGSQPCPALPPEEATSAIQGNSIAMTAKVIYKEHTIKFLLSSLPTMKYLEEEVMRRLRYLNISLDKIFIKYQDEEDDWISPTCDSDLMHGLGVLRSSGKTLIRMMVTPKSD